MIKISENGLSILILMQRIIAALAFLFLATGQALHLNAFIQNGIDIGLPYAAQICTAVVILTIGAAVLLLIGLFTRTAAYALIICALFTGFFFFAGSFNKVNIVGVLLALGLLAAFAAAGAGRFSIDGYIENKRIKNNKRLTFR